MEANHRPVASSFKLEVGAAILTIHMVASYPGPFEKSSNGPGYEAIHMGEAITNYYDCHYKTCNSQNSASLPSW